MNETIKISLHYSSQIQRQSELLPNHLDLDKNSCVQDVVRGIVNQAEESFRAFLFDDAANLRSTIILAVNDKQVRWSEPCPLSDGDRIDLLSPIAGG